MRKSFVNYVKLIEFISHSKGTLYLEKIKGKELKKKWIRFEYGNVSFEGELEYREGDLTSLLGQKIYEIKITKPLPYSISFTLRKEAHPIRRLFYGMGKVELDVILNMVLKEAIAYYFNKEQFININDDLEERMDEAYEKSKPLIKPIEEQIETLNEARKKLKELQRLGILTLRERRSKVNLIKDKIGQLYEQIIHRQISLLKDAIEENKKIKQQLFKFFDKSKLKIIEINDVDG